MDSMQLGIQAHAGEVMKNAALLTAERPDDSGIEEGVSDMRRHIDPIEAYLAVIRGMRAKWPEGRQK